MISLNIEKVGQIVQKFKGEETHTRNKMIPDDPLSTFKKERGPQICFIQHQNLSVTSGSNSTLSRDTNKVIN